ncbi:MAG: DUF3611 family protein [Leptolyngbyaceae cyanobacterium MO_188.B28]|nr:DUF3611 family protein [Leptolyngbyaceae cyanobacterium MO_188.B28]
MAGELDYSLPPAVRRIARAFARVGWISFWIQIVLAVVSALLLIFAVAGLRFNQANESTPGTDAGLFFATCGLLAVFFGAYWSFRYTRVAKQLRFGDSTSRPKPKDAIRTIQVGLYASLIGMFLCLMGAGAIAGALTFKSFEQSQGPTVINPAALRGALITPFDLFILQSNTNTSIAHFVAILSSLWLSRTVNRQ